MFCLILFLNTFCMMVDNTNNEIDPFFEQYVSILSPEYQVPVLAKDDSLYTLKKALLTGDEPRVLVLLEQEAQILSKKNRSLLLAALYYKNNKKEKALGAFEGVVETKKSTVAKIQILMSLERFEESAELVQKLLLFDSNNAYAPFYLGQIAAHKGLVRESIDYYRQAVVKKTEFGQAYYYLGNAWAAEGDFEAALKCLTTATKIDPKSGQFHFQLGLVQKEIGDLTGALLSFDSAVTCDYSDPQFFYNKGEVLLEMGDLTGALSDFDQAIELSPDAVYYFARGIVFLKKHDLQKAFNNFTRTLQKDPNHIMARFHRYKIEKQSKYDDLALKDLNYLIDLKPDESQFRYNRANLLFSMSRFQEAIEGYTQSLKLDPGLYQALSNRGYAYQALGEHTLAERDMKDALDIYPNDAVTFFGLGVLYATQGHFEQAATYLKKAVTLQNAFKNRIKTEKSLAAFRATTHYNAVLQN